MRSSAHSAGAASASWGCRQSGSTRSAAPLARGATSTAASGPTSGRVRSRWERLALAQRRGEAIPPIEVYRVGHRHFVSDGHHRVSIAAATGQQLIDAYVTQVLTTVPPQTQTAEPPRCWR
jgi:hypothetical protein